jgi:hypothetical protein
LRRRKNRSTIEVLGERKAFRPDAAYLRLTGRRMGRHGSWDGQAKA